jgi:hypothetical protein
LYGDVRCGRIKPLKLKPYAKYPSHYDMNAGLMQDKFHGRLYGIDDPVEAHMDRQRECQENKAAMRSTYRKRRINEFNSSALAQIYPY